MRKIYLFLIHFFTASLVLWAQDSAELSFKSNESFSNSENLQSKPMIDENQDIIKTFARKDNDSLKFNFNREPKEEKDRTYITDTPFDKVIPVKANKELQVFVYSYNQAVVTNIAAENELLKGQIVGRLFGGNTTSTSKENTAQYFEQRTLPFFVYSPGIFDGKATIRASFLIDWTFGDSAYGTGGHTGGAISGSNVNIQTQNVDIEYLPAPGWAINLGLQRMYDTPNDPYRTTLDKMVQTGYRLMYWGTNGAGITVRKDADRYKLKGGYYKLYENDVKINDDVTLMELTSQFNVDKDWNVGGSVYYLSDRSNGRGGVSILGQGPASLLADYNGAYRFPLGGDPFKADVVWLGGFFSKNENMFDSRIFMSGFVNANLGSIQQDAGSGYEKTVDIAGLAANLKTGYRYGQTENDYISMDLLFSTGNKNGIENGKYSGVITGNTWGSPVGLLIGTGSYLVFPHGNVVNRYVGAVSDLSNLGYGLAGGTLNAGYDIIPNKLHSKIGTAMAMSNVKSSGGGKFVGWEVNGNMRYDLGAFLSVELHAAYMGLGDFYKSSVVNGGKAEKPANPWTVFAGLKWLIF